VTNTKQLNTDTLWNSKLKRHIELQALQKIVGTLNVSIHPLHLSVLSTVVFHPRFRHDIQTTAAVFCLTSSERSARSSLYSRQASVSGFWCHSLERPASPCSSCAVTHGFQTTTQDRSVFPFLPRHYHMTCVLLYNSSLLSGHLWSLQ